jgi:hypothetical protein
MTDECRVGGSAKERLERFCDLSVAFQEALDYAATKSDGVRVKQESCLLVVCFALSDRDLERRFLQS